MNILKLFILITLCFNLVYSQHREPRTLKFDFQNSNYFSNFYSIPITDSTIKVFYFYKIPFTNLIFEKNNDHYLGSIQVALEIGDSSLNYFERQFKNHSISVEDFAETTNPDAFINGMISFSIGNKNWNIISAYTDLISQKEIYKKEQPLLALKKSDEDYPNPIIISKFKKLCNDDSVGTLINYGNYIPFEFNSYDILIPVRDPNLESIYLKLVNDRDTIFVGKLWRENIAYLNFSECEREIILMNDKESGVYSIFSLYDLTPKLKEGQLEFVVSKNSDFTDKKISKMVIKWIKKPNSLRDAENAIKLLRFIINEDSVKALLRASDDYTNTLYSYWSKWDPTPDTKYNELMSEYYERVDYAASNFSTITGLNGIETDRAKIYIRLGKPSSIERGSNEDGKVFESWIYRNPERKFIFIDTKGTGEFTMQNSL